MNPLHSDLEALFNRVADGIASEADEQQLGELLRSSPEATWNWLLEDVDLD